MNLARFLLDTAARFGDRPAIEWGRTRLTYRELERRTAQLANALRAAGLGRGDRIAVYMDNRPELIETLLATFRAGAVIVPCNSRSTPVELGFILDDCNAYVVVTDEKHFDAAKTAAASRMIVTVGDDYEALLAGGSEDHEVVDCEPSDTAWIFYTSGTTGSPKGAMLSHAALTFVTVSWHADLLPMTERDVTLHVAPLSHAAGFHALAAVAVGAHQIISDSTSFDPELVLCLVRARGVTNAWMVPTQIIRMTAAAEGADPLPTLERILYGGAPIARAALSRALEVFGPIFVQLYGQGETPMTISVLRREDHTRERLGTAGYARLGMEVAVIDEVGTPLPAGFVGEVVVRGPALMSGYLHRAEATEEALRGGWLHTGDLGTLSADGLLTLLDRTKDVIISGGSNVYAAEVEAVLTAVPGIAEAAVVGVTDALWGERVEAVIVVEGEGGDLEQELDRICREKLSGYKLPRRFHRVPELPRNAYGKVVKSRIREHLAEGPDPAETM